VEGYVYVISNKGMPDYVKVGHTTRSPEERALELSGTATPFPAVVEYSVFVENARAVELEVHRRLAKVRASKTREWFKCSRSKAIETIKASIGPATQREHDRVVAEEEARLRADESRRQAEQKRQNDEAEKFFEEARKVARAAVYAKYNPKREALARPPHYVLFWIPNSLAVMFVLAMLGVTDKPNELLPVSLLLGAILASIWQMRARGQRENSSQYLALIAARDSELAAVANRRDGCAMMASASATATKNPPIQPQSKSISTQASQQAGVAVTASEQPWTEVGPAAAALSQPSWLSAASAPRAAGNRVAGFPSAETCKNLRIRNRQ
jgi:hypothetical protein